MIKIHGTVLMIWLVLLATFVPLGLLGAGLAVRSIVREMRNRADDD